GGDGDAARIVLRADVHHVGGTLRVEVGQSRRRRLRPPRPPVVRSRIPLWFSSRFWSHGGRYHKHMSLIRFAIRVLAAALCVALAAPGMAFAQSSLPDLGSAGDAVLSPQLERRIGENIVREIRFREPGYMDDPEISEYLAQLGARLAQAMPGAR